MAMPRIGNGVPLLNPYGVNPEGLKVSSSAPVEVRRATHLLETPFTAMKSPAMMTLPSASTTGSAATPQPLEENGNSGHVIVTGAKVESTVPSASRRTITCLAVLLNFVKKPATKMVPSLFTL